MRTRRTGGGYLLQHPGKAIPCDFTPLESHDDCFEYATFISKHTYHAPLVYGDDDTQRKRKPGEGTNNVVQINHCEATPYVLRRLKYSETSLLHCLGKKPHAHGYCLQPDDIQAYLTELQYQAMLAHEGVAPHVYMVGCLKQQDDDLFELFCMMEEMIPLENKKHITTDDLKQIENVYHKIAEHIPDEMTFVDVKYPNMVYDDRKGATRFLAIDFDGDLAVQDDIVVSHYVRGQIMYYLFLVFLLLYGGNRLTPDARSRALRDVHYLLTAKDVVTTMWRWYHEGLHKQQYSAFPRIINCYSFRACQYNPEKDGPVQPYLQHIASSSKGEIVTLLKDLQLSFLPHFHEDEKVRSRFVAWGYHRMYRKGVSTSASTQHEPRLEPTSTTHPREPTPVSHAKEPTPVSQKKKKPSSASTQDGTSKRIRLSEGGSRRNRRRSRRSN